MGCVWYSSFWSEGSVNPLNLKMLVPDFVPRDLEWLTLPFEVPLRRHSRYHVRRHLRSQGTKCRTQMFIFGGFIDPSDQKSNTTPHYYPKYEIWSIIENKLWDDPSNVKNRKRELYEGKVWKLFSTARCSYRTSLLSRIHPSSPVQSVRPSTYSFWTVKTV